MGLYEKVWKDDRNRTLLLSSIILLAALILAIVFASWEPLTAPSWLVGLYYEDPGSIYGVGLTIITAVLVSLFYFFLLLALATFSEIRANLPSWGTFVISSVIAILVTWMLTEIRPKGVGGNPNYNTAMQWTIFGVLIGVIILSIVYIFLTEPDEEEEQKSKDKGKDKKKK